MHRIAPDNPKAVAFIDGQNLYHRSKAVFGYTYPNYDPAALTAYVCNSDNNWEVGQVEFYTGVPDASQSRFWSGFWSNKLAALGRAGIVDLLGRT